jgi:NADPH:quinone reductase-like Zn-dependent oxidoreductase
MKAIQVTGYGRPEKVLRLVEVEKPKPDAGRVLVRVHASSMNPVDLHSVDGLSRIMGSGIRRPKDPRLGSDIAGQVEEVGEGATKFKAGDEVFGTGAGGYAEYAVAREIRLARKPANMSFEAAASVPVAGLTALQGLRKGGIKAGQKVLVNGASGGVGTFAVQIAKAYGAEVTGVCSPRNVEQTKAIGADRVIDYTKEDFTKLGDRYDIILDVAGSHSPWAYKRALAPGGACMIVGFAGVNPLWGVVKFSVTGALASASGGKRIGFMGIAKIDEDDLAYMGGLMEAKKVVPVIDRRFPLEETAAAMSYLAEGHARGKVAVTILPD